MKALKDIYFYNAFGLASELRNGTVTEVRALKHLIVSLIIGGAGFDVPLSVEFKETSFSIVQLMGGLSAFIIAGIISYYGVWLTYQVNNKGDGKDYFLRFSSLSLPVGVQLAVLFLVVGVILIFLSMLLTDQLGVWGGYLTVAGFYVAGIIFAVMFFMRMHKYIAIAAGVDE